VIRKRFRYLNPVLFLLNPITVARNVYEKWYRRATIRTIIIAVDTKLRLEIQIQRQVIDCNEVTPKRTPNEVKCVVFELNSTKSESVAIH